MTCQTDTVNVRVPLYPIETIPLTVTLKDGETLKGSQVRASISPQSVKVLGDQNTLAELTEISLGEIDLDSVRDRRAHRNGYQAAGQRPAGRGTALYRQRDHHRGG